MNEITLFDTKTPYNVKLTGIYKQSFAHYTLKERLPVILTTVLDFLVREKDAIIKEYGSPEDLKEVIGGISKLKYELQTNKTLQPVSCGKDQHLWNKFLKLNEEPPTYFETVWLYAECYIYRRLKEIIDQTSLKGFDPFRHQKIENFTTSINAIKIISNYMNNSTNLEKDFNSFTKFMKLGLWGNKCDLSLSLGVSAAQTGDPLEVLVGLDKYIIANNIKAIWESLNVINANNTITIITDNAGYELFTDFCLADYLISSKLATTIVWHIKSMPWFISDVNSYDFHWIIDAMIGDCDTVLSKLGSKWKCYLSSKQWVLESSMFWTSPIEYEKMKEWDPCLYAKLGESKLAIFKGDLNFRKLLGDYNWEPTTPFNESLQGFLPTNICSLRTNKADLISGIPSGVPEVLGKDSDDWLISGEYGVILFASR